MHRNVTFFTILLESEDNMLIYDNFLIELYPIFSIKVFNRWKKRKRFNILKLTQKIIYFGFLQQQKIKSYGNSVWREGNLKMKLDENGVK